jgi:hypothetical protein
VYLVSPVDFEDLRQRDAIEAADREGAKKEAK